MPSMKDVAKHANVSIATVSKVINNKGSFSEETRNRVLQSDNEPAQTEPKRSTAA
jgi:DNA-binding LacI/PurR family transcriptional regulator